LKALFHAFDDPHIAIGTPAEDLERFLVRRAIVGGRRLCDAVEFDDHDALDEPGLVGLGRRSARQEPPTGSLDRRTGELGTPPGQKSNDTSPPNTL
jgi:hypothetical protein